MKTEINTVLCNWQWISLGRDFDVCIFAGRRFAAWKVCCQVKCVFIYAVNVRRSLEQAFRALEGLSLEAESKDCKTVICFTVYLIWHKLERLLSFLSYISHIVTTLITVLVYHSLLGMDDLGFYKEISPSVVSTPFVKGVFFTLRFERSSGHSIKASTKNVFPQIPRIHVWEFLIPLSLMKKLTQLCHKWQDKCLVKLVLDLRGLKVGKYRN